MTTADPAVQRVERAVCDATCAMSASEVAAAIAALTAE
jgi:hypothetical protein